MARIQLTDGSWVDDGTMSCPYCAQDAAGNHQLFCPLSPYQVESYVTEFVFYCPAIRLDGCECSIELDLEE